jgi:hypothetical protein
MITEIKTNAKPNNKAIEIRADASTLPREGERVKFHIPKEGWKEGVYLAKEQMFHFDGGKFHYAWEASEWESLEEDSKRNIELARKLIGNAMRYPVAMRVVADLHRRGVVKSPSDLQAFFKLDMALDGMDSRMRNDLQNQYENIFMNQERGMKGYAFDEIPKP